MALTALTTITHGKADGERVTVPQGEKVPAGLFSKEELTDLKDQGLVGEPPPAPSDSDATEEENTQLKERVAELEKALGEAKSSGTTTPSPPTASKLLK